MSHVRFVVSLLVAGGLAAAAAPAAAQDIKSLGNFGQWRAYSFTEDGRTTCYMASEPTKEEGDYTQRGDVYATVTHRPWKGTRNVVSFVIGYPFKKDSTVNVDIDGNSFTLFTHDNMAWAPDEETDQSLVQRMVEGVKMVVKGTSARGTLTTDTYSLIGFTKAHSAINTACPAK